MTSELGNLFHKFLTGRLPFPDLVDDVVKRVSWNEEAERDLAEILKAYEENGELPKDLIETLREDVAKRMNLGLNLSGQRTGAASAKSNAGFDDTANNRETKERLKDKIDDVVLSDLAQTYSAFRDKRQMAETSQTRDLDALLGGARSLRMRREADRAKAGRVAPIDLEAQRGARKEIDVGSYLKDRFVIDRVLGKGGMSTVYAAIDRRRLEAGYEDPYVALKVIADNLKRSPYALQLLEAETRKAQTLAHPNVVTVFDFDRDQSDVFIVMEMLTGQSLADSLHSDPTQYRRLKDAEPVILGAAAALTHAHAQNVVHADVKPANIFITAEGECKVLDFGISTAHNLSTVDPASLNALTRSYASPQMIEGQERASGDDVFSFGVVIYAMLSGDHPFSRRSADTARAAGIRPIPITDLSRKAWQALDAALAYERKDRPSVAELVEGLYGGPKPGLLGRLLKS